MFNAKAYSAASATSPLASTTIPRRDTAERDVQIEILQKSFCSEIFGNVPDCRSAIKV